MLSFGSYFRNLPIYSTLGLYQSCYISFFIQFATKHFYPTLLSQFSNIAYYQSSLPQLPTIIFYNSVLSQYTIIVSYHSFLPQFSTIVSYYNYQSHVPTISSCPLQFLCQSGKAVTEFSQPWLVHLSQIQIFLLQQALEAQLGALGPQQQLIDQLSKFSLH